MRSLPFDAIMHSATEIMTPLPARARASMFLEVTPAMSRRHHSTPLASFLERPPGSASSFDEDAAQEAQGNETGVEKVQQHDCGYCLGTGEKRCCEFEEEGTCTNCCKEHFTTDLYCRMNCARMCRRGIFKGFAGGKQDVPVCPVGEPNQAIQTFDLKSMTTGKMSITPDKYMHPYMDWKGEKYEKEWLESHPLEPSEAAKGAAEK
mmetsp:Transcript_3634/g.7587  ORF Transcript_3634/g.7587 Transcript_3634/m.7587 type:complete len:206 (-) Transcript_3634:3-620(-)